MENVGRMERVDSVLGNFSDTQFRDQKIQTPAVQAGTVQALDSSSNISADQTIELGLAGIAIIEVDIDSLWSQVCAVLQDSIDEQIFAAWIKPLKVISVERPSQVETEAIVTVSAPNKFCSDHVQRNYCENIRAALGTLLSAQTRLVFKLDSIKAGESSAAPRNAATGSITTAANAAANGESIAAKTTAARASAAATSTAASRSTGRANGRKSDYTSDTTNLNPKYNFSNFVVGSCNQLAHAVGLKVAEDLGSNYNPLFIYGGVGLGKTHLANAIGNSARRRDKKVLLVSSETFVSELIRSLRSYRMDQFKSKFRSLDLLIVDDIQFIIGKERTQEEFFHTFNELYNRHKQIIITCDKVPQELVGLEERLRTRFASGLSVDLQAPDFETRVAILVKKAETEGVNLPEDVARCLAERIQTNVRELEGALNRLKALSSLQKTSIYRELAEEVLNSLAPQKKVEITSELVQKLVAEKFNVSVHDLLGKRRTQNIALARQLAMYLVRRNTSFSYPEIGAFFGGRDHSTVIHAFKTITERIANDRDFQADAQNLEKRLLA